MDALPDFVKVAEAYGHVGFKVENPADVEPVLKEAFGPSLKERLVFIDFRTDQTENVFPMIQNGRGLNQMDLPPHMQGYQQVPFENNRDYGNLS